MEKAIAWGSAKSGDKQSIRTMRSELLFKARIAFSIICLASRLFASAAESSAEAALRQMKVAPGFVVKLVASEPEIRQPLSISFDDRGRMWVIQYLQYPTPAGLTPVRVDQFLRTTYDKIPEPPPRGPKGADRITICDDVDGLGKAHRFK